METLKSGDLAYFDTFAGLIPCKVLKVYKQESLPGLILADIKLTATRKAYKRGETLTGEHTFHIVPRKAILRGKYTNKILPYSVQIDATNQTTNK